ncbi:MAG: allophycocyanin [Crocosphaera sp.]|nr:allophycocyanin [Crocosphaera sp.]
MLTQFSKLSLDTDGRYASDSELQFLESYLDSTELRISAYEKIRDNEEKIIADWETERNKMKDKFFENGGEYVNKMSHRDITIILRCSATAMLVNDLDKLRDGMLIWVQTIFKACGMNDCSKNIYRILQEIIPRYLSPEETKLILPALQVNQTVLSL